MEVYILHIDTATTVCSVALSKQGVLLNEITVEESNMHAKLINTLIRDLMVGQSVELSMLSAISIAIGPGSYTGLRVGLSAAKGLAYGLDLPIIEISTLEALAEPHRANPSNKSIVAALDARRDEVYMSIYTSGLEILKADQSLIIEEDSHPDSWPEPKDLIICGNGAEKIQRLLGTEGYEYSISACKASNQIRPAYEKWQNGKLANIAYVKPNYLKPPNITKSTKKAF